MLIATCGNSQFENSIEFMNVDITWASAWHWRRAT